MTLDETDDWEDPCFNRDKIMDIFRRVEPLTMLPQPRIDIMSQQARWRNETQMATCVGQMAGQLSVMLKDERSPSIELLLELAALVRSEYDPR